MHVTKRICGFPSFFNLLVCKRIKFVNSKDNSHAEKDKDIVIKLKQFLNFWRQEIQPFDPVERFFRLVKQPQANYITKDDFAPFIQELLVYINIETIFFTTIF